MRRSALLLGLALLAGCAGVTDDDPEDYSDPPVPEDAELPEGADAPLLPPNEGEKDDVFETVEDAVVAGDSPVTAADVPVTAADVPVTAADVPVAPVDVPGVFDDVPATMPDPTRPPPPCRRTVGPFTWTCDGPVSGARCVALTEPQDPDGWSNNHLCTSEDLGVRWSSAGPVAGMRCILVNEPAEPPARGWGDNHLCVPSNSRYALSWSYAGPIPGRECVPFFEPADPHTWADNYLCFTVQDPPAPPRCTGSASGQSAVWTCTTDRRARQRCVSGVVQTVGCPHGCVPQPSGTNDYCAPAPPPPNTQPACARRPLLRAGLHPDASDRLRCAGVPASRITQTIGYYAASAGTHAPDGRANGLQYSAATDISTRGLSHTEIRAMLSRLADQGFAGWYRWPGHDGWPSTEAPHIHTIYVGCAMKSSLDAQVRDWLVGRNGLRSHATYTFLAWSARQRDLVRALYNRFN